LRKIGVLDLYIVLFQSVGFLGGPLVLSHA
jgi:hypothetical protein